jgi:hypothetical protein
MRYTYQIEVFYLEKWMKIKEGTLSYLQGYLDGKKEHSPRNAHRIIRDDGKVIELIEAREDVSIGMIAGFPSAQQYELAAQKALDAAKHVRERRDGNE